MTGITVKSFFVDKIESIDIIAVNGVGVREDFFASRIHISGAQLMPKEKDGLDALLFGGGVELVDLKCFRGDREDVSEDEIKQQIHSAFMQKRMNRAVIAHDAPRPSVPPIDVQKFVSELMSGQ